MNRASVTIKDAITLAEEVLEKCGDPKGISDSSRDGLCELSVYFLNRVKKEGGHPEYDNGCCDESKCERIAGLEAERDLIRAELQTYTSSKPGWDRIHNDVCRERDALAARNAELHDVAGILLCIDQCEECRADGEFNRDGVKRVINREAPASLAQRDAGMKAEALYELALCLEENSENAIENGCFTEAKIMHDAAVSAITKGAIYRHQAKGGE